jgi:hypothetical protein
MYTETLKELLERGYELVKELEDDLSFVEQENDPVIQLPIEMREWLREVERVLGLD